MKADEGMNTVFGFTWGPAIIERSAVFERGNGPYRVLRITTGTATQDLDIYISPNGRSIRVFRGGSELKPDRDAAD